MKRNTYIDIIRVISVFLVVLYHYTYRYNQLFESNIEFNFVIQHGSYAVLTFFLMSGYFATKDFEYLDAKKYGIKRFFRLFPSYWVAIIIVYPITKLYLPTRAVSLRDFFLNFTMCQTIFGAGDVDGAYWTLFCELFFYCLVVLICILKLKRWTLHLIIAYAVLLVLLNICKMLGLNLSLMKVNDMMYLYCFLIGVVISLFHQKYVKSNIIKTLLCISVAIFEMQQFFLHNYSSGLFLVASTMIFVMCIKLWDYKPIKKQNASMYLVRFLVDVSFPLYLVHQNIGYVVMNSLDNIGATLEFILIIPLLLTFIIAVLLHYTIEIPFGKLGNKIISRIEIH